MDTAAPELTKLEIALPPDADEGATGLLMGLLSVRVAHGWEEKSRATGESIYVVHLHEPHIAADLAAELREHIPGVRVESLLMPQENWMEAWKEFFTPVECGAHFLVIAPWMNRPDPRDSDGVTRLPVIIEPKTAFGTGHHASTALCLETLSRLHGQGLVSPGMRFLDLGTGSGILGLAAARLGLTGLGLDTDPIAVENALENRELNGILPGAFEVAQGDLGAARPPYDLILANILAGPLREMAPEMSLALARETGRSGLLVLSGILISQADQVAETYLAQGLTLVERPCREEWAALVFRA